MAVELCLAINHRPVLMRQHSFHSRTNAHQNALLHSPSWSPPIHMRPVFPWRISGRRRYAHDRSEIVSSLMASCGGSLCELFVGLWMMPVLCVRVLCVVNVYVCICVYVKTCTVDQIIVEWHKFHEWSVCVVFAMCWEVYMRLRQATISENDSENIQRVLCVTM